MKEIQKFIRGLYQKKHFGRRVGLVLLAVIVMGFSLSWLVQLDFGTDPCTSFNIAASGLFGISLGNWQALFNTFLAVFVVLWGREYIGFGSLANMFLVGYAIDFFSWVWGMVLPAGFFDSFAVRTAVLIPALAVFIFAVAVYIDVQLGTAPYDAIPFIICKFQSKISFRVVRCLYDIFVILAAWLLGAKIGVITLVMGFTLGPVIAWVSRLIEPLIGTDGQ